MTPLSSNVRASLPEQHGKGGGEHGFQCTSYSFLHPIFIPSSTPTVPRTPCDSDIHKLYLPTSRESCLLRSPQLDFQRTKDLEYAQASEHRPRSISRISRPSTWRLCALLEASIFFRMPYQEDYLAVRGPYLPRYSREPRRYRACRHPSRKAYESPRLFPQSIGLRKGGTCISR